MCVLSRQKAGTLYAEYIFCMAPTSDLGRKLKEYLVPGYKLNNLLSNYAFQKAKVEVASEQASGRWWFRAMKCRKKRMKLWQTLGATRRSPPFSPRIVCNIFGHFYDGQKETAQEESRK